METLQTLFALVRSEIVGAELNKNDLSAITEKDIAELYSIAKKYDISAIVTLAILKSGVVTDENVLNKFNRQLAQAVSRYEQMNYEYENICKVLDESKIFYVPLKGSYIRKFYPEPWMRTSCDIDILVKEEQLNDAVKILKTKLKYKTDGQREFHDVSVFSPSGIHLELHFNIYENLEQLDRVLDKVWQYVAPISENETRCEMTNEYLLFHNLAHMTYHVLLGGCGIRPFIDLYLLEKNLSYDENLLSKLCSECGIDVFRKEVEKLSKVWMEGNAHDELSLQLQNYILEGGLYGNQEIGVAIRKAKKGGKFKYAMQRIFQPYYIMKEKYPILKKHKWLLPFYQVKRWFRILISGNGKRSVKELKAGGTVSCDKLENTTEFLNKLGLGDK